MQHPIRKIFLGLALVASVALLTGFSLVAGPAPSHGATLWPCQTGAGQCYLPAPSVHSLMAR
ncbi:hypothetical protein D9M68_276040 [compost metagenome]